MNIEKALTDYSTFAQNKKLHVKTYEDPQFIRVLREAVDLVGIGKVALALSETDPSVSEIASMLSSGQIPWVYGGGYGYRLLYRLIPTSPIWDSVDGWDYWN